MAAGSQEVNQYGLAAFFTCGIPKTDDNESGVRKGAEVDKNNFEEIFWKILNFEPLTDDRCHDSSVENLTLAMWEDPDCRGNCGNCWTCKIKDKDCSLCKYVLLGFSSHGREDIVDGVQQPCIVLSDGGTLPLSKIFEALERNRTLADKPRIVIHLACRVIAKEPEIFEVQIPEEYIYIRASNGSRPILKVVRLSDTSVQYTVQPRPDVQEYDVRWIKKGPISDWNQLVIEVTDETTSFRITNLEKDTSYCVIFREKTSKGFGPYSEKDYIRTTDAEDEGGEVYVGEQKQKSDAQGFDFGDPPKKKFTVTPVLETDIALYSAENIPNNFLVVYGANRGRMSKRNEETGSWVLNALLEVLRNEEREEWNIFHLLTRAAYKMSLRNSKNEDESLNNKKSILCFSHTLTENIMLRKREMPAPSF